MQKHIDHFELLQREIEFHSTAMSAEDVNIAFLLSLGESDVWKTIGIQTCAELLARRQLTCWLKLSSSKPTIIGLKALSAIST